MITPDNTWFTLGVSKATICSTAERLAERKELPQRVHHFFEQAGRLMLHSWYSYPFASIAFFHAVLGVEKSLRLYYGASAKISFKTLFEKAVDDGVIHDGIFEELTPIRPEFKKRLPKGTFSHSATLAQLVPNLRNEYFHGEYILADDFLPLSLRLREVADALAVNQRPNK